MLPAQRANLLMNITSAMTIIQDGVSYLDPTLPNSQLAYPCVLGSWLSDNPAMDNGYAAGSSSLWLNSFRASATNMMAKTPTGGTPANDRIDPARARPQFLRLMA
jgi:hypothetical protein